MPIDNILPPILLLAWGRLDRLDKEGLSQYDYKDSLIDPMFNLILIGAGFALLITLLIKRWFKISATPGIHLN